MSLYIASELLIFTFLPHVLEIVKGSQSSEQMMFQEFVQNFYDSKQKSEVNF